MRVSSKINSLTINKFFWTVLIFYPSAKAYTGSTSLSQQIMHLFFASIFIALIIIKKRSISLKVEYIFFLFLSLSYFLLLTLITSNNIIIRDLGDPIRPLIYFFYFSLPFFFKINISEFKKIFSYLIVLLFFQIAFSTGVYFEFMQPIIDLYKGRMSNDEIPFHYFRWSGTFIYPSDFSFFLSFFIYYYFNKIFLFKRTAQDKSAIFTLLLLFITLFMTVSRGGIFTVIGMLGIISLYIIIKRKLFLKAFMVVSILVVLLGLLFQELKEVKGVEGQINYFLMTTESGKVDDSTSHRLVEFNIAKSYFLDYFPFGAGPNRVELKKKINVIESLYGYYMSKWGFLGLSLYFVSVFFLSKKALDLYKVSNDTEIKLIGFSFFILTISVPLLFGLSSAVTDRFKGLPFYYVMAGYIVILSNNKMYEVQRCIRQ